MTSRQTAQMSRPGVAHGDPDSKKFDSFDEEKQTQSNTYPLTRLIDRSKMNAMSIPVPSNVLKELQALAEKYDVDWTA